MPSSIRTAGFFIYLFVVGFSVFAQAESNRFMLKLTEEYEAHLSRYPPNPLVLDFKQMLSTIISDQHLNIRKQYYDQLEEQLQQIDPKRLTKSLKTDYHILQFETELNLELLRLVTQTTSSNPGNELERIFDFEQGAAWYAWLIKKWTGSRQSPREIMQFGMREVDRIKQAINDLPLPAEKPSSWYTQSETTIRSQLDLKSKIILKALPQLMPDFSELPRLHIDKGQNSRLARTPGYYSANTFYYNLFDSPFDLADCDWLLIHEGNPGHHFQVNYHHQLPVKPYRSYLRYMGFVEGWAAYTENLGWPIGLYKSPWEALGKWNWDLIRSVRIVLDVGINYYGWSEEKALDYWKKHIRQQDDIAMREINRMKRWPAQVLTYKLGEAELLKLLAEEKSRKKHNFSYKNFHTAVLSQGIIPVFIIADTITPLL